MAEGEDLNLFVQWRHAAPSRWKFCPLCQAPLTNHEWDGKSRRFCSQCGFVYWERPLPATAGIIYDAAKQNILLVTRRYPPSVGGYTLPGGGIEFGESVQGALLREVFEETGLKVVIDDQLGTWSTPSNETLITFFVTHPVGGELKAGTDAMEATWVNVHQAPRLAFSVHQKVVELFRAKLALDQLGKDWKQPH